MIEVDDLGRTQMKALREGVSQARYLDDVWHRRDEKQGRPAPISAAWPFRDVAHREALEAEAAQQPQKPEARVNVAKLPVKLRSQK